MSIKNGDLPAMPQSGEVMRVFAKHKGYSAAYCAGLTKREQFAMAAMQGILANQGASLVSDAISTSTSELAVLVADALLAELDKSK